MIRPSFVSSVAEDRPRTVYFYGTSECNSNCSYCVFRKSNMNMPRVHMPLETVKRTWMESEILRSCGIVVQGGEFTIHPEALGIMEFFDRLPLPKITLLTNAVDPELAMPLIYFANQVTISLDGPKHDLARGVEGNLKNVLLLLDKMKESSVKKTIQTTLGPWNAGTSKTAIENVRWLLGVCMQYEAQPRFNIASDDGLLGIAHYDQKLEILKDLAGEMLIMANEYKSLSASIIGGAYYIKTAVHKMSGNYMRCNSISIYSTIGADGSVWMCQGLGEEEAVVGNVNKKPYDIIWLESRNKRNEYHGCQACSLSCQLMGDIAFEKASG